VAEIVYVLSNPAMPGLLKIGMTDRADLAARMRELYTTGVPLPFDCVYACVVEDNKQVEAAAHQAFAERRVNPRREFFRLEAIQAVEALKPHEVEDITPGFREDLDAPLTEDEKDARREVRRAVEQLDPAVAEAKFLHLTVAV
jgi:hypothetical protein